MHPPLRLYAAYQEYFNTTADWIVALPEREMWIAAEIVDGHQYTLIAPDLDGRTVFDRRSAKQKRTTRNRPLPRWARYPAGVLLTLSDDGLEIPAINALIVGNEAEGPRYEYSMGMVLAALLYEHNQQPCEMDCLLELMERVQKQYI